MSLTTSLAILGGKTAGLLSRATGRGGGTALAGLVATRIDDSLIDQLARQIPLGSVVISATNGKTTTARMTAAIARAWGAEPIHNRAGSNLLRGVATALLDYARPNGSLRTGRAALGIFEVDEGVVPLALPSLGPRAVALGNLFRDQLDRYGEIDLIAQRWQEALAAAPAELTVCLNADDPVVAALGRNLEPDRVIYYGVDDTRQGVDGLDHAADSKWCPDCGRPFEYSTVYYAHLGWYTCPVGHWSRPAPAVAARRVDPAGLRGSRIDVVSPQGFFEVTLPLPGLFNVYNALAAISLSLAVGCPVEAIQNGLSHLSAAFGRLESLEIAGRRVWLLLSKNPTGFNASLRTVFAGEGSRHCLLVLNDRIADGRDISWIWDVDFEPFVDRFGRLLVSGTRAEDLALRLKYAVSTAEAAKPPEVEKDLGKALDWLVGEIPAGEEAFVLATYTAMLDLQALLTRRGLLPPYWDRQ